MDKDKVLDLAKLARIKISEDEAESLSHEFNAILKYVGEVKEVSPRKDLGETPGLSSGVRNLMREDGEGHESGLYTEKILASAPAREGDYIKVKKIL